MDIIMNYLLSDKKMPEDLANRTAKKITRYDDIRKEFESWIETRTYNVNNPIVIEGYTAQEIFKLAPFMDGLGVFNFMITLRDHPRRAKEYIDNGFSRK